MHSVLRNPVLAVALSRNLGDGRSVKKQRLSTAVEVIGVDSDTAPDSPVSKESAAASHTQQVPGRAVPLPLVSAASPWLPAATSPTSCSHASSPAAIVAATTLRPSTCVANQASTASCAHLSTALSPFFLVAASSRATEALSFLDVVYRTAGGATVATDLPLFSCQKVPARDACPVFSTVTAANLLSYRSLYARAAVFTHGSTRFPLCASRAPLLPPLPSTFFPGALHVAADPIVSAEDPCDAHVASLPPFRGGKTKLLLAPKCREKTLLDAAEIGGGDAATTAASIGIVAAGTARLVRESYDAVAANAGSAAHGRPASFAAGVAEGVFAEPASSAASVWNCKHRETAANAFSWKADAAEEDLSVAAIDSPDAGNEGGPGAACTVRTSSVVEKEAAKAEGNAAATKAEKVRGRIFWGEAERTAAAAPPTSPTSARAAGAKDSSSADGAPSPGGRCETDARADLETVSTGQYVAAKEAMAAARDGVTHSQKNTFALQRGGRTGGIDWPDSGSNDEDAETLYSGSSEALFFPAFPVHRCRGVSVWDVETNERVCFGKFEEAAGLLLLTPETLAKVGVSFRTPFFDGIVLRALAASSLGATADGRGHQNHRHHHHRHYRRHQNHAEVSQQRPSSAYRDSSASAEYSEVDGHRRAPPKASSTNAFPAPSTSSGATGRPAVEQRRAASIPQPAADSAHGLGGMPPVPQRPAVNTTKAKVAAPASPASADVADGEISVQKHSERLSESPRRRQATAQQAAPAVVSVVAGADGNNSVSSTRSPKVQTCEQERRSHALGRRAVQEDVQGGRHGGNSSDLTAESSARGEASTQDKSNRVHIVEHESQQLREAGDRSATGDSRVDRAKGQHTGKNRLRSLSSLGATGKGREGESTVDTRASSASRTIVAAAPGKAATGAAAAAAPGGATLAAGVEAPVQEVQVPTDSETRGRSSRERMQQESGRERGAGETSAAAAAAGGVSAASKHDAEQQKDRRIRGGREQQQPPVKTEQSHSGLFTPRRRRKPRDGIKVLEGLLLDPEELLHAVASREPPQKQEKPLPSLDGQWIQLERPRHNVEYKLCIGESYWMAMKIPLQACNPFLLNRNDVVIDIVGPQQQQQLPVQPAGGRAVPSQRRQNRGAKSTPGAAEEQQELVRGRSSKSAAGAALAGERRHEAVKEGGGVGGGDVAPDRRHRSPAGAIDASTLKPRARSGEDSEEAARPRSFSGWIKNRVYNRINRIAASAPEGLTNAINRLVDGLPTTAEEAEELGKKWSEQSLRAARSISASAKLLVTSFKHAAADVWLFITEGRSGGSSAGGNIS